MKAICFIKMKCKQYPLSANWLNRSIVGSRTLTLSTWKKTTPMPFK